MESEDNLSDRLSRFHFCITVLWFNNFIVELRRMFLLHYSFKL